VFKEEIKMFGMEQEQIQEEIKGISLSDNAANKIKELVATENHQGKGFRVLVAPGGCSGMSYDFSLEKEPKENEKTLDKKGVKVFINDESSKLLSGAEIDYVDSLQGAGFKVNNPNAKSTCGCGDSFC
jgi:iron-sulfur cluster assembly protein